MSSPAPQPPPTRNYPSVWRIMLYTAGVLAVLAAAQILLRVRDLIFLLLIGILLATAIDPVSRRLRRIGMNRGISILTVYLLIFLVVGAILAFMIPPIVTQATEFVRNLPNVANNLERRYATSDQEWVRNLTRSLSERLREWTRNPPDITGIVRDQAVNVVSGVFGGLLSIVTVILISFYWMTERTLIRRALLGFVPTDSRTRVNEVWDHIETKLGQWFRAQLTLSAILGVAAAIGFGALGLPYWPLLALFAGVVEIIPILGPWIGGVPAVLIALTEGPVKALAVAVFIIILQQIESNVFVPRIQGDAIGLSPLTVILAILAGTTLAGPVGGILAVPISAMIQVLIQDLVIARATPEDMDIESALDTADEAKRHGRNGTRAALRSLRRRRLARRAVPSPPDDAPLPTVPGARAHAPDDTARTHDD